MVTYFFNISSVVYDETTVTACLISNNVRRMVYTCRVYRNEGIMMALMFF